MKSNYIDKIKQIVGLLTIYLNIENFQFLYIPDNFNKELFDFQISHHLNPEVSNNEFGKVQGKTILYDNDGKQYTSIFFDKECANYIIDAMGNLKYEEIAKSRNVCINMLHHEFVHVHESNMCPQIYTFKASRDFKSIFSKFGYLLWSEYYACKLSASSYMYCESDIDVIIDSARKFENSIDEKKCKYQIDVDLFLNMVLSEVYEILQYIAYYLGHSSARSDMNIDILLKSVANLKISKYIEQMSTEMEKIFEVFPDFSYIGLFSDIGNIFTKYFNDFGIVLNPTDQGIVIKIC